MSDLARIERACELRGEGLTYKEVAAKMRVHITTAYRLCNPESVEKRRESDRRYREANRERRREYDRNNPQWKHDECPGCGGIKARTSERCADCWSRDLEDRRARLVEMWGRGDSLKEIADDLGMTVNYLGCEMNRMRKQGYDLPLRYAVKNGKRVPK